jgi:N-acetylneuraminate synthase
MPRRLKLLFLLPARGGSKRIPRKNLTLLAGLPLIVHVLRAARLALDMLPSVASRLMVSTDDRCIAAVARAWGAEVPFLRPRRLAGDRSPTLEVVGHALVTLEAEEGYVPHGIVLLQATSPLVEPSDIAGAVRLFLKHRRPVVSVTPNEHPLEWSFRMEHQALHPAVKGKAVTRRQAARPTVRLNGAVYIAPADLLRCGQGFVGPQTLGFVMPPERSIDIDTPLDLRIAESLLEHRSLHSASSNLRVGNRPIGPGQPCFIIAEAGVNHNGDLRLARHLIDAAVDAGADAVKFQTFRAQRLASASAPKAAYQKRCTGTKESQLQMLKRLELSEVHHRNLFDYCRAKGILFLSSPFDETSADFLGELGVAAFKIPSGEITNLPFLTHLAQKRKPLILSTGMSTLREVAEALEVIERAGNPPVALLQCTSDYPARSQDVNLRAMNTLSRIFRRPVGYSDHTKGIDIAMAAAAVGACILEKHFTLDRRLPGPDHQASIEPDELKALVSGVRQVAAALGTGEKVPAPREAAVARAARKSLVADRDLSRGTVLMADMIGIKRPGTGMSPAGLPHLLGRRLRRSVRTDHLFSMKDVV